MAATVTKQSYTIPCPSRFRDQVLDLARRRDSNAGDVARSVIMVVPPEHLSAYPDPGEPAKGDREVVMVKSGPSKGRPWHRKPRLQVRMAAGFQVSVLRRALALALALDRGDISVALDGLEGFEAGGEQWTPEQPDRRKASQPQEMAPETADDAEELARLGAMVSVLAFEPLPGGVKTRAEAMHVLGLPPGKTPDIGALRARFRMLAVIHHPDSGYGSHERMSQLNSAMDILGRDS